MPSHSFQIGSVVSLNVVGPRLSRPSRYVVEALMPPLGVYPQYRIKAEGEGFRRVAGEDQLSHFDTA